MPWAKVLWKSHIPHFRSFTLCRYIQNKLPIDDNLASRACHVVSYYKLCFKEVETVDHAFFFQCSCASHLWDWTESKLSCRLDGTSALSLLDPLFSH